jgi:CheY-like chemotaxis protein
MYLIYVSNDVEAVEMLEEVLHRVDKKKLLIAVSNGYDLIQFLQNVKEGESYPDLIILSTHHSRLNGRELLELLKTDDIYRMIPVIMFVAREHELGEVWCERLGTETILSPTIPKEWVTAARKICAACN